MSTVSVQTFPDVSVMSRVISTRNVNKWIRMIPQVPKARQKVFAWLVKFIELAVSAIALLWAVRLLKAFCRGFAKSLPAKSLSYLSLYVRSLPIYRSKQTSLVSSYGRMLKRSGTYCVPA